ncbi:MAG: S41 family peptidase [Planctomycetota bacterium]
MRRNHATMASSLCNAKRIRLRHRFLAGLAFLVGLDLGTQSTPAQAIASEHPIRMVGNPSVSPDGSRIAFSWIGEIWSAGVDGSDLQRLTHHRARERQPLFSPDGTEIAFVSNRNGSDQIFVMNVGGTNLRQITFHSAGYELADWFPDGRHVLALGSRDHFHRDATRLIKVDVRERKREVILADAMAEYARVSPSGERILFTREGERWWRKGYQGARSTQVWMLDLTSGEFRELVRENVECMWPTWMADGKGFYFTKGTLKGADLWRYRFGKKPSKPGKQKLVHSFTEDSIVYPAISRDGGTLVFRHLFDLYVMDLREGERPTKVELSVRDDVDLPHNELRRELSDANDVAFTQDGLEIAFVAGGDVWVMDTVLREPKRVTSTDGYEEDVTFSPDGDELWFVSTEEGQADVYRVTRGDDELYWWQNETFRRDRVTNDMHVESDLRFTADGQLLVMQQGRGDLVVMDVESEETTTLVQGFSGVDFDLSSDSGWMAFAKQDDNFNREIWLAKLDGSIEPVNVSRHPDNDGNPRFSADGKLLAFTGRRVDSEVDIYYVYLQEADDDETSRERKIEEAIQLMEKDRKKAPAKQTETDKKKESEEGEEDADAKESDAEEDEPDTFQFELDRIHERLRKISIPDSSEGSLLFAPEGQKLAFRATIDGESGWYTVEFPNELKPKLLTTSTGSSAVWYKDADGILFLRNGSPAKIDKAGKLKTYDFEVAQTASRAGWLKAGFNKAWLIMRDAWYDGQFANRNWDAVRRKYAPVAEQMHDTEGLAQVVQLMLGELNGSHLGFYPSGTAGDAQVEGWEDVTAHLGVRFQTDFRGPGMKVRDVLTDGPADRADVRLQAGDVVLSIDGTAIDPALDLTTLLNGRLDRDITLQVKRDRQEDNDDKIDGKEMQVVIRPISYSRARSLLYEHWLEHNRGLVEKASGGKLGYLHIRGMNLSSFYEFERQLYNVGYGRDGLVIDVRDNGGGFTTDLLLTALTQPRHAITQPRGGGPGYPHDRAIFATWSKPIVVLCNQNSYSNAEIFSHAIKTLGRGKVVGIPTAGGVISTGSASVHDVGRIRVPFRGWFLLNDGQDMERNGCQPDEVIWPLPGELPQGIDRQLDRAVECLLEELGEGEPAKTLQYASERDPQ